MLICGIVIGSDCGGGLPCRSFLCRLACCGFFAGGCIAAHVSAAGSVRGVSQWLEERTADIGFLSYQENMPFEWIPLAEDPMLALLPRNHPLAGAASYPLKRCEQDSFIMPALGCDDDVEALFARNHVEPNIRYTTIENFSAMSMVEQGLGVSVMNKLITEKRICDVAMIPIDPPASITLGAALHSQADASPAVKMFLKYAVRMLTKSAV